MKILNTFIFCFALLSCNNTTGDFARFLNLVPNADLPFELKIEDWKEGSEYIYSDSFHYQGHSHFQKAVSVRDELFKTKVKLINEFIGPSKFVRVTPSILPVVKFKPNRNQYSVIYAYSYYSAFGLDGNLFLRTFDESGNELETFDLTHDGYTSILISSITSDGKIKQENYEKIWKLDFETHRFENNEVVDYQLDEIQYYEISKDGKLDPIENKKGLDCILNSSLMPFGK